VQPKLSIVIPTHKRPAILRQCLERIAQQTIGDDLEVIVVSDGHDEEARRVADAARVKFFSIPKSQQGQARNEGVKHATAPYVLFIGDDIFLDSHACERHLKRLSGTHLTAVLGFTTWDPAVGITPVMIWLEKSGWQFGYPKIRRFAHTTLPRAMQHRFTYTSHISLPTEIAKTIPFRSDMHTYGWEDIEWGMRLASAGIKLYYEPSAQALHHHRISMEDSLKRMEILGRSAIEMSEVIPRFDRIPRGLKRWAYKILGAFPTLHGRHRKAFMSGLFTRY